MNNREYMKCRLETTYAIIFELRQRAKKITAKSLGKSHRSPIPGRMREALFDAATAIERQADKLRKEWVTFNIL